MKKDVLEEIVAWKRVEVEQCKAIKPLSVLARQVESKVVAEAQPPPSMREALMRSATGIIAEFKRKSPSKGWINEAARPEQVTLGYQQAGASAVSILTDDRFFGGTDGFVTAAREAGLTLPVLYKNFVVDEYQLFQARLCGASAVLLIAADLTLDECRALLGRAHDLQLEVLLEVHGENELDYVDLQPDMCGVNNRHLGTFVTDVANSFRLAAQLPEGMCKVSESGISNPDTVARLRKEGFRGFLIGEFLMKAAQPEQQLAGLLRQIEARLS